MALSDTERRILLTLRDGSLDNDSFESAVTPIKELSSEGQFYVPWLIDWEDPWSQDLLWWVLGSEHCDAATAMAMYWLNQSWDWLSVPAKSNPREYELQGYRLAAHIQDRMASYAFPSIRWSYDPAWHHALVYAVSGNVPQHVSWLPDHMRRPTPGETLASDIALSCW